MTQSCLTLCDPMDCSPPGFSVHEILQARILDWVAIPFSRRSSQPRDQPGSPSLQADSLPSEPPGKPVAWSLPTYLLCYYCYLIFNSLCLSITGFIQYIQCFFSGFHFQHLSFPISWPGTISLPICFFIIISLCIIYCGRPYFSLPGWVHQPCVPEVPREKLSHFIEMWLEIYSFLHSCVN